MWPYRQPPPLRSTFLVFFEVICCFHISVIAVEYCLRCLYTPTIHCASPKDQSPCCVPSGLNRNSTILTLKPSPYKSTSEPLFINPPHPPNIVNLIKHHPPSPPPKKPSCALSHCIGTMTSSTPHFLSRSSIHTHSLSHPPPGVSCVQVYAKIAKFASP